MKYHLCSGSIDAVAAAFFLSGLLGFVLRYRSPVSVDTAFLNLGPALVGLFAVPSLLLAMTRSGALPPQKIAGQLEVSPRQMFRGSVSGLLGGLFAAFFPGITGGIGGLLAGHAAAQRDDRVFLAAQSGVLLAERHGGERGLLADVALAIGAGRQVPRPRVGSIVRTRKPVTPRAVTDGDRARPVRKAEDPAPG